VCCHLGVNGFVIVSLAVPGVCQCGKLPQSSRGDLTGLDRLLRLMGQRLTLMHDVARSKWNARQPIAAPQRERELLRRVVEQGRARGLDPKFVESFFVAQMQAARLVEQADFDHWKTVKQMPFNGTTSLPILRRRIDNLNRELLDVLADVSPVLSSAAIQQALPQRAEKILVGVCPAAVRHTAIAPLKR
jgi:chorismate mutase-like protein